MKRVALLFLIGCFAFLAPDALAVCEVNIDGPYTIGSFTWTYYHLPGPACWWTSGDADYLTNSCYSEAGFDYGYGVSSAYYEFTLGEDDILGAWYADARINFNDPNNNSFNQLKITATVTHNGTPTTTTLFLYNGGMGDLSCYDADQLAFDAVGGDTIRITVESRKWYNDTVIQVTTPQLTNSTF